MPEIQNITFSYKEIAEALIKAHDIHEGLWGIYIEFGIAAANVNSGPGENDITPAAIVPIVKIGIQKFPIPNNLTVDAAIANPISSS